MGENAERRLADRQLVELGVDTAELLQPALVARLHLDVAHRQRGRGRAHGTEAAAPGLGLLEQVEIDLDVEDLLHAADVRVAELLVRIEERAAPLEARAREDDLVAVDIAAAALELVLRPERYLGRAGRRLLAYLHMWILGAEAHPAQDLTNRFAGASNTGEARLRRLIFRSIRALTARGGARC